MRKTPQANGALAEMLAAEHGVPPGRGRQPLREPGIRPESRTGVGSFRGKGDQIRRLRSLLARYDTEEVAAVEARVRHACVTTRPEDAEEFALLITLAVLRLQGRVHVRSRHELVPLARLAPHDR
jgi:hypothetical protein